jgi:hypothetical protein
LHRVRELEKKKIEGEMEDDLGSMFADLSFETLTPNATPTPNASSSKAVESIGSRAPARDANMMMTLRGVSAGVNLDALILSEEAKAHRWKNLFNVGDEVEAVYTEDGVWYLAKIDQILEEAQTYNLTFPE